MKRLVILGNYSMKSWLSKAAGPYNVTLLDVEASGAAEIERDADGNLQATDSEMDMTFLEAKVDLQNMGVMRGFLQGIVASAGPALFEAIKPSILKEVNDKMRSRVNAKIKTIGDKFVPSDDKISPIDKAVAEGRRYVRDNGYDPYKMEVKHFRASSLKVTVSEFVVSGLSKFNRVGGVTLSMDKGHVIAGIHLATKQLYGSCRWNVSISDFFHRDGVSYFTVKQLQVKAKVSQSLDVKKPPKLLDLDIFLGPVRLQMDKSESFNFIIEFVVNTMPALIRHVIVDTLEIPIKQKIQEILDKVDVEKLVNETLPELDNMGL